MKFLSSNSPSNNITFQKRWNFDVDFKNAKIDRRWKSLAFSLLLLFSFYCTYTGTVRVFLKNCFWINESYTATEILSILDKVLSLFSIQLQKWKNITMFSCSDQTEQLSRVPTKLLQLDFGRSFIDVSQSPLVVHCKIMYG